MAKMFRIFIMLTILPICLYFLTYNLKEILMDLELD